MANNIVISLQAVRRSRCPHDSVEVDESAREVTCATCCVKLDPITVLGRMAHDQGLWDQMIEDLERKAVELGERLDRLRADERNARARLKRMGAT